MLIRDHATDADEARRTDAAIRLARLGAAAVVVLGAAVLLGWAYDVAALKSVAPGFVAMKANTAVAFVATGAAMLLLAGRRRSRGRTAAGLALAVLVVGLGAANLVEDLAGVDLGIDELLVRDGTRGPGASHPGRMSPATAFGFVLLGLAVVGIAAPRAVCARAASAAALCAHVVASVALLGYAYAVDALYRVGPFNTIAVHTAAGLWLASLGAAAARPDVGLARLLVSSTAGGAVARRLVPAIPLALTAVGGGALHAARSGLFGPEFAIAVAAVLGMVVAAALVLHQSFALRRVDGQRREAEAGLVALNDSLERRVLERTRELEEALSRVQTLEGLIPMCAWCRRIEGDAGSWLRVEDYVSERTRARMSHGICPACLDRASGGDPRLAAEIARRAGGERRSG